MAKTKRSAAMRQMLAEYEKSGLTRRVFCQQRGIPVTTLDYWRRQLGANPRLVKVDVAAGVPAANFTLTLGNGRRIESWWQFGEAELARLIRVAERA